MLIGALVSTCATTITNKQVIFITIIITLKTPTNNFVAHTAAPRDCTNKQQAHTIANMSRVVELHAIYHLFTWQLCVSEHWGRLAGNIPLDCTKQVQFGSLHFDICACLYVRTSKKC